MRFWASTQHYAIHDDYPQRRYTERVTIKGGPVAGAPEADPATISRLSYAAPAGVGTHGGHKPHEVPRAAADCQPGISGAD